MFSGEDNKAKRYNELYILKQQQIDQVFWDEEEGTWFDYHLASGKRDKRFAASMVAPIFTQCHGANSVEKERKVERFLSYIKVNARKFICVLIKLRQKTDLE